MNKSLGRGFVVAIACAAALGAACNNGSSTPVSSTATNSVSIVFSHPPEPVLAALGTEFDTFTTTTAGEIDATLLMAGPPPTILMGFALGVASSDLSTCNIDTTTEIVTAAGSTAQLSFTAPAGVYCVAVIELGNTTSTVSYTVQIVHV